MANAGNVVTPVVISGMLNIVTEIKDQHVGGALKVGLAHAGILASLVVVGQFVSWELAGTMAALLLLYTFLTDGADFIDWFSRLVDGN